MSIFEDGTEAMVVAGPIVQGTGRQINAEAAAGNHVVAVRQNLQGDVFESEEAPPLRPGATGANQPLVMRQREGKDGGGKGPLMAEDQSLTLATSNDQTLFIDAYACRGSASPNQNPVKDDGVSDSLDTTGPGAVAYGIDAQTWSRSGDADTPSPDAEGRMRLRPPGLGIHEELSPTVTAALPHAAAFRKAQKAHDPDDCERWEEDEVTDTLASHGTTSAELVAFANTAGATNLGIGENGEAPPITTRNGDPGNVAHGMLVRRLTPLECERLQGFPDGWTDLGENHPLDENLTEVDEEGLLRYIRIDPETGKPTPDSTRYRQLGNAVAVPVIEWIAERIGRFE